MLSDAAHRDELNDIVARTIRKSKGKDDDGLATFVVAVARKDRSNLRKHLSDVEESVECVDAVVECVRIFYKKHFEVPIPVDYEEEEENACPPRHDDVSGKNVRIAEDSPEGRTLNRAKTNRQEILREKYSDIADESWGMDLAAPSLSDTICEVLDERKRSKMCRAIEHLGKVRVLDIFRLTLCVESVGGLMTADGSRRRSKGGVFWRLLQKDVTKTEMSYITQLERMEKNRRRNQAKKRAHTSRVLQPSARAEGRLEEYNRRHGSSGRGGGIASRRELLKRRQRECRSKRFESRRAIRGERLQN